MAVTRTLKNGTTITVTMIHKCSWCGKEFSSEIEWDNHRVRGKYFRICPNECQQFGKVTAKEYRNSHSKGVVAKKKK